MLTTPCERFLLFEFERLYGEWAGCDCLPGERPDLWLHRRWLAWLALDLAQCTCAAHASSEGEIETDDRLGKLDCDGRFVVWVDGFDRPLSCPRSPSAWPPKLAARLETNHAA